MQNTNRERQSTNGDLNLLPAGGVSHLFLCMLVVSTVLTTNTFSSHLVGALSQSKFVIGLSDSQNSRLMCLYHDDLAS